MKWKQKRAYVLSSNDGTFAQHKMHFEVAASSARNEELLPKNSLSLPQHGCEFYDTIAICRTSAVSSFCPWFGNMWVLRDAIGTFWFLFSMSRISSSVNQVQRAADALWKLWRQAYCRAHFLAISAKILKAVSFSLLILWRSWCIARSERFLASFSAISPSLICHNIAWQSWCLSYLVADCAKSGDNVSVIYRLSWTQSRRPNLCSHTDDRVWLSTKSKNYRKSCFSESLAVDLPEHTVATSWNDANTFFGAKAFSDGASADVSSYIANFGIGQWWMLDYIEHLQASFVFDVARGGLATTRKILSEIFHLLSALPNAYKSLLSARAFSLDQKSASLRDAKVDVFSKHTQSLL